MVPQKSFFPFNTLHCTLRMAEYTTNVFLGDYDVYRFRDRTKITWLNLSAKVP